MRFNLQLYSANEQSRRWRETANLKPLDATLLNIET